MKPGKNGLLAVSIPNNSMRVIKLMESSMSDESLATIGVANSEPAQSAAVLSHGQWVVAILLAGVIGWLGYSYRMQSQAF